MTELIVTHCARCEQSFAVEETSFGQTVRCPACDEAFVVSVADLRHEPAFRRTGSESSASPRGIGRPRDFRASVPASGVRRGEDEPSDRDLPSLDQPTIDSVGRFQIRRLLGRGAFGSVYLAYDPLLDRQVALKVPTAADGNQRQLQRFLTEAKAAARLRHPGIVAVLESGQADGRYFIASEFIEGETIAARLKRGRPPLTVAARWVRDLAEALAYAHASGVVHRDIKPENVMLDAYDRPQIMDFGLAKRLDADSSVTVDGSVIGTPAYMSPEQARGELEAVGPQSDQYSLGVLLYELLTQRKPFDGPPHAVIAQVAADEPPAPRTFDPQIPKDLEAICRQSMEKDARRRYRDLNAMARDLDRWLCGQETSARPLSWLERAGRWGRRRPGVAALAATVVVSIAIGFSAVAWQWRRAETNRRQAEQNLTDANEQRQLAEDRLAELRTQRDVARGLLAEAQVQRQRAEDNETRLSAALSESQRHLAEAKHQRTQAEANLAEAVRQTQRADLSQADADRQRGNVEQLLAKDSVEMGLRLAEEGKLGPAMLWLARSLTTVSDVSDDARESHVIRANLAFARREFHTLVGALHHEAAIVAVAVDPNGRFIVTAAADHTVRVWDASNGQLLVESLEHEDAVTSVAVDPRGRHVLVCHGRQATLRKLESAEPVGKPWEHPAVVVSAAFSPDGNRVVTGCADFHARVWSSPTGRLLAPAIKHEGAVLAVAFSPDGKRVLTSSGGDLKRVRVWDAQTAAPIATLFESHHNLPAIAFRPDGEIVATGGGDNLVRLWNAKTGAPHAEPLEHRAPVLAIAFESLGRLLLTGCADHSAQVWDVATGQAIGQPFRHANIVTAVAFNAKTQAIVTGSADGLVRVWRNAVQAPATRILPHEQPLQSVAMSRDGRWIVTGGRDHAVRLWDAATGAIRGEPMLHTGPVTVVALSPDGTTIASASEDRSVRIWDTSTTERRALRLKHDKRVTVLQFSSAGRHVITGSDDGTGRVWGVDVGQPVTPPLEHKAPVVAVAFHPDGGLVATASTDRTARLWDARTGRPLGKPLEHQGPVTAVAFSPDGRKLITASADMTARQWQSDSGEPLGPPLKHTGPIRTVAYSPDARLVLTGSDDHSARLWDAETSAPLGEPFVHSGPVSVVTFNLQGTTLLTAGEDGTVWLWDVSTRRAIAGPLRHPHAVHAAMFDATGTRLVTAGQFAWLWDIPAPVEITTEHIMHWAEVVTGMELDENGDVRVLPVNEWRERQLRLESLGLTE